MGKPEYVELDGVLLPYAEAERIVSESHTMGIPTSWHPNQRNIGSRERQEAADRIVKEGIRVMLMAAAERIKESGE